MINKPHGTLQLGRRVYMVFLFGLTCVLSLSGVIGQWVAPIRFVAVEQF